MQFYKTRRFLALAAVCIAAGGAAQTDTILIVKPAAGEAYGPFRQVVVQTPAALNAPLNAGGVTLAAVTRDGRAHGQDLLDPQAMEQFYADRGNRPLWFGGQGNWWFQSQSINPDGKALLGVIADSWTHGLNPARYHYKVLHDVFQGQSQQPVSMETEILMTDAFVRYAQDLSGMRVSAQALDLAAGDWLQPLTPRAIFTIMGQHKDLAGMRKALEPSSLTYQALREALIKLAHEPPEPYRDVMPLDFGKTMLKPGQRHGSIPALRKRLGTEPQSKDALLYDDRLTAAVIKFQREHGLKEDAIVGGNTLRALNRTREDRMRQIVANLERIRWLSPQKPEKYVIVNIPSATLWAIDGGQVEFEMSIIVGRAKRPTPSFVASIKGVRFNPDWTVPPTIKQQDIWPKLIKDPHYLSDKGIALYRGYERDAPAIEPDAIDWADLKTNDLHGLRMVQMPGSHNPLGRIRVLMPNQYNVYLHDTNERSLFSRYERAQSSGCMRMEFPEVMAEFIMRGQKGWDAARIQKVLSEEKTRDYLIAESLPIYVVYYTAWVDKDGSVVFGTDIYDNDEQLLKLLEKIDGVALTLHNDARTMTSMSF